MMSRGRMAADDDGVGKFTSKAEGQPTIGPFKMHRTVNPMTSKESILPMNGAPLTVHVVWEVSLILNLVSQRFHIEWLIMEGPPCILTIMRGWVPCPSRS